MSSLENHFSRARISDGRMKCVSTNTGYFPSYEYYRTTAGSSRLVCLAPCRQKPRTQLSYSHSISFVAQPDGNTFHYPNLNLRKLFVHSEGQSVASPAACLRVFSGRLVVPRVYFINI